MLRDPSLHHRIGKNMRGPGRQTGREGQLLAMWNTTRLENPVHLRVFFLPKQVQLLMLVYFHPYG